MKEIIQHEEDYYILATSARVDERTRVLKQGETFAVFDRYGDVQPVGLGEQGLYHHGTRHLSRLELLIEDQRPVLLSSTVKQDNSLLLVDLTNGSIPGNPGLERRGAVHFLRSKLLWEGAAYERLRISNYALTPIDLSFTWTFASDFADLFEVRGKRRTRRGRLHDPCVQPNRVTLVYEGLDGFTRRVSLEFEPAPAAITSDSARFTLHLERYQEVTVYLTVRCLTSAEGDAGDTFDGAALASHQEMNRQRARDCRIATSNEQFDVWVNRALADLHMMATETPDGPYPYAGVPWFCTPFGRDGSITALQMLWVNPDPARGVLHYLAATQSRGNCPEDDAEPGKILHESRRGEMAALREIPFGRYYGSVDSTPLFVMLAGAYHRRTGDRGLVEQLWPNIRDAVNWIIEYGDRDHDGFVEYERRSSDGLINQCWKDSYDSIMHADGSMPSGPIAVCEVQGYTYAAFLAAAQLGRVLGQDPWAEELEGRAARLRQQFDEAFWSDELGTYALALDGDKRPCLVRTSNAGHCLYTGIARPDRAAPLVRTLMSEPMFSGWGVRTLATTEARFNPMSYHNGSIWPHDNAMIAAGFARYGFRHEALRILGALFDVTQFVDLNRLPELFCGFSRRVGEGPTLYPVACSPQAWASGAVFMLLEAILGLGVDALEGRLSFTHPFLPPSLEEIEILGLRSGRGTVDLLLRRHAEDVGINVLRREGALEVVNVK